MPEGPEVRRAADALHAALAGKPLRAVGARTKVAKAWMAAHDGALVGRRVERVWTHGKHLVGDVEGGVHFHSHFYMWGRWHVVAPDAPEVEAPDRRERARLIVDDAAALLYSAPRFAFGEGDPYEAFPQMQRLGPDVLPYAGAFDARSFRARLLEDPERFVGAALLDQHVAAGVGNYLRAEILFACRIDPWKPVGALTEAELGCLEEQTPALARRAYETGGRTVPERVQEQMLREPDTTYAEPTGWNTRHWVFRRTNLPCLRCGGTVRQKKQVSHVTREGDEKERIVYFCPTCQGTTVPLKPSRKRRAEADA